MLVLLTALSAVTFMDRQILAVLLQPIKQEFGFSDLQIGLITGLGFAITFGLLGIPMGRLADRVERRSLVAWCRGIGGGIAALGALATGSSGLTASRGGAALGDAGGGAASMSMLADLYAPHERSRVMSIFGMGGSAGAMLALLAGPVLAELWGWRVTMALVGLASVVLACVLRWTVGEPQRSAAGQGGTKAASAAEAGSIKKTTAVLQIWREPVTRWLIVGAACALFANLSFGAWNTALLARRFDLSLRDAGWISAGAALFAVSGALISGWLTDKLAQRDQRWQIGVPVVALSISTVFGLGYLLTGTQQFALTMVLLMGYALFSPWWAAPTYAALSLIVPSSRRATASAMVLMSGALLGNGLGPIVAGLLSDFYNGIRPGDGLRLALLTMGCFMLPSVFAFSRAMAHYPQAYRLAHAPAV
ncbi:MFS transporter [Diaphorobacter sp. HDW4A]|nr:MFS transporter [Diaphorobacter sp. HDW4A]